jgi:uncharacterized YccA/Bax inhibitor family protein
MKSSNPAFRALESQVQAGTMDWSDARSATMTVQGTAVKAMILTAILMTTAAWSWVATGRGQVAMPILIGAMVVGLITALITCFKPAVAPFSAPVYAAAQGVFLGAISHIFNARYPGIVVNAVSLTMMTLFAMLVIYSSGLIRVTDKLRAGVMAATMAIMGVYLVSMLLSLFMGGRGIPYIHESGPIGIAFSLFVVGLAAFNLLLDFDFIEKGSESGLPKTYEWFGAFGLMVTLIWLYLEILRLLAKLQDRR